MAAARERLRPATTLSDWDYNDGLHIMKMWVRFFESRLRLVEALEAGFRGGSVEQIAQKLSSAIEYSREMQMEIGQIRRFIHVFDHDDESAKESLIAAVQEEIDFLKNFDPEDIAASQGRDKSSAEQSLEITELMMHPNPMSERATFCYNLTSDPDEVTITIYTVRGKRVRTIAGASARSGYNEEMWIAEDDDRRMLGNGTYLYKVVARKEDEKVQKTGKLSILR